MLITVVGRKCTPREAFKERAEKKLSKIDRFFGADTRAKITATVEKNFQTVEITVYKDGMIFRAQAKSDNIDDALDESVQLLIRQIRKNKTKLEKRFRDSSFDGIFDETEEKEDEYELVREKTVPVKPQSVEEAILQMNLLGHGFYMFKNSETNSFAVIYKRSDGGYGLIEPEDGE